MKFRSGRRSAIDQDIPNPTVDGPPPTEAEIGQVLLDIQKFADASQQQAEAKARAVIDSARREADDILGRATEEAGWIGPNTKLDPEEVGDLIRAIDEFSQTNRDLLAALLQLRDYLDRPPPPPPPPPPPSIR